MNILEEIIENKRKQLKDIQELISVKDLEKSRHFGRKIVSLSQNLSNPGRTGIIAEFKRKSPTKGDINLSSSVEKVTSGYFSEGASGVSILTDNLYFGGSAADIILARNTGNFPILRKDFIIDEYQVIESKSIGADCILLIAAVLDAKKILELSHLAHSLGLETLLEIHDAFELDTVNEYINIIGINNRNLRTFEVKTDNSVEMAKKIPSGFPIISESGISSSDTIKKLRSIGYDGFLIGERFMCSPDPVKAFAEFVKTLN